EFRDPELTRALDAMVEARLVTVSDESVEITHEALIRYWPRLARWIDSDRECLIIRQRISDAALAWSENRRDKALLLRGSLLAEARALFADGPRRDELGTNEEKFIQASVRQYRRRAGFRSGTVALLVAALITTATGYVGERHQRNVAESQRHRAV